MSEYNIFKALHLEEKELIHSAMIAAIVSKDDNRKSFINKLKGCLTNDLNKTIGTNPSEFKLDDLIEEESIDVKNEANKWIDTEVRLIEKVYKKETGYVTRDRGRADIWIGTNKKGAETKYRLIIENKIKAGNQYRQLRRYYRYLTETGSNGKKSREFAGLFFLCVKGDKDDINKAAESAKRFNNKESNQKETVYAIITYKDIISWLEQVIKETEEGDFKTAVKQYKEIIKGFYPETKE